MIKHLVLVGCGHMGYAMLRPWVEAHTAENFWVVTPRLDSLQGLDKKGVRHIAWPEHLPPDVAADIIVLAVRPEILTSILPEYRGQKSLFLSVAAGKPLEFYQGILGADAAIVRAMPNLPAKVGEGMTLLASNAAVSAKVRKDVEGLLAPLGKSVWIDNEPLIDAATAISGCGPAYFYFMVDQLAQIGEEGGLKSELATGLARQTCTGSAALLQKTGEAADSLYHGIAVKGGLTEAALDVFRKGEVFR